MGWEGQTIHHLPNPPFMSALEIPTGPPISDNKHTYCAQKRKAPCAEDPVTRWPRGSITYDREKGGMTREWANEDDFLAWLAAKESEKHIELIVSKVVRSDSPIWRERHVFRCGREYTGRKQVYKKLNQWERAIPSKKTGCRCHLTIKLYPDTATILGKYEEQHDHALGDKNLRFTRLSDATKKDVMQMVHLGVHDKAIVRDNSFFLISGLMAIV